MMSFYQVTFGLLILTNLILLHRQHTRDKNATVTNQSNLETKDRKGDPAIAQFKQVFFCAYMLASAADWLQVPAFVSQTMKQANQPC